MTFNSLAPGTLIRKARMSLRKLWVRVVLMGLLSLIALGLAHLIEGIVPKSIGSQLTGDAADVLLKIIAGAMLAVTTFSLSVMVAVYRSNASQWTPRVNRLLMQNPTTQNTLAAFIGSYVYSLVAIILRETGVYSDDRALVLFVVTVCVLAFIVVNLIRWTLHLQTFGGLVDTGDEVQEVTQRQFIERLNTPCLGARPLVDKVPDDCYAIRAPKNGYVQHIHPESLNSAAKSHGVELYLVRMIGAFIFVNEPMVMVRETGSPDEDLDRDTLNDAVLESIVLGNVRTFEQDPRFGLMVMGEIGSKALSPGINDAGTAIDVIHRIGSILTEYTDEAGSSDEILYEHLWAQPLDPKDLIEDGYGSIGRDGAAIIEVQQRLQASFKGLMQHPDEGLRAATRTAAGIELRRAWAAMDFEHDRARLRNSVDDRVWEDVKDQLGLDDGSDAPEIGSTDRT